MKEVVIYLNFDGNCREAMEFYKKCLGAELQLMPFADLPAGSCPPGAADRVLHARIAKGSTVLMASDTMPGMPFQQGNNFSINLVCESMDEITSLFAAFGEGGTIVMPLQDQFWGSHFGLLKDKFGIHWMFNYELPKKA